MIPSRTRLAIIPARGGSKRIEKKNIKMFHGRPMIHHTLEYTSKSELFDTIHVSTESEEIRNSVLEFGLKIDFERPENLSDDNTTLFEVIKFTVSKYAQIGKYFDEIWLIMACAPLTSTNDLEKAAVEFDHEHGLMIAVAEMPVPIEWAYTKTDDDILEFANPENYKFRSQDLTASYYDGGAFAIFTQKHLKQSSFSASPIQPFYLPKQRAIDIDTNDDWVFAEALYEVNKNIKN